MKAYNLSCEGFTVMINCDILSIGIGWVKAYNLSCEGFTVMIAIFYPVGLVATGQLLQCALSNHSKNVTNIQETTLKYNNGLISKTVE